MAKQQEPQPVHSKPGHLNCLPSISSFEDQCDGPRVDVVDISSSNVLHLTPTLTLRDDCCRLESGW